jgi:hypothetical protein
MRIKTLCKDGGRTYYEVLMGDERVFVGLKDECRRYVRVHDEKAARDVRDAQDLRLRSFLRLLSPPVGAKSA